jgi:hypothetical protein
MATKIIDNNGIVSFDSISSEEDLNLKPRININPPPADGKCDCCGRHISELEPFGKAGDPLVGDFEGALLIKKWRPAGPYDEEAEKALFQADKCLSDAGRKGEDPIHWMVKVYGKEKGEKLYWSAMAYAATGSSWECRDCAVLDEDEYFEKLKECYLKQG